MASAHDFTFSGIDSNGQLSNDTFVGFSKVYTSFVSLDVWASWPNSAIGWASGTCGVILPTPTASATLAPTLLPTSTASATLIPTLLPTPTASATLMPALIELSSFQAVANDPTSAEFWDRHRDFHWALLAPAANSTIRRVLDYLWQSSERYVRLFVSTFATMETVMDLHVELYEACAGKDVTTLRTRSFGITWKPKNCSGRITACFRIAKPEASG